MQPGKSPVYICSAALQGLGRDSITSLNDVSRRAVLCNRLWPTTRDFVLTAKDWGVTYQRAALSKDSEAPAFNFLSRFRLPEDFNFLLETDLPQGEDYQIEGDFLLCNFDTVNILYIKDTPNSSTYGPLLTGALIAAMKAELAYPMTGDLNVQAKCEQDRDAKLGIAASRESQQRSPTSLKADILVRVRR